jgi:hypothetical protein
MSDPFNSRAVRDTVASVFSCYILVFACFVPSCLFNIMRRENTAFYVAA